MNFHIHHSAAHHHYTCCPGSSFRLPWENMAELGEVVDRKSQGQDMVTTDSIPDIAATNHPYTGDASCLLLWLLGTSSSVTFITTYSLGQTHAHTHKNTANTSTSCKQHMLSTGMRTQSPETPVFPVCICVPKLSMCVYTHMCLCQTCLCVCVHVCMCVQPRADTEMKVTGEEVLSNHKKRQEVSPL